MKPNEMPGNTASIAGPAYEPSSTRLAPSRGDYLSRRDPSRGMSRRELQSAVETLRREVARLTGEVRQLQDPRGNVFLAAITGTNGTFLEVGVDQGGTSLAQVSTGGRQVTGTADPGLLLIPRATNAAVL